MVARGAPHSGGGEGWGKAMSDAGMWWDAETAEAVAIAICWAEFISPPPGLTAEDYWRLIAPKAKAHFLRLAGVALQAAKPRVDAVMFEAVMMATGAD